MFTDFLFHLRAHGLKVSTTEWLSLMDAMSRGFVKSSLAGLYSTARAVLVKKETEYDIYDRAFGSFFEGIDAQFDVSEELLDWLSNPKLPKQLSEEDLKKIKEYDWDTLREEFEKRLKEQKERHDGGNHWVGTGGTSAFGSGGFNPMGIRVGDQGGGRSAVQVATDRRFQNLRSDRVLDTRQIGSALRRLRRLAKDSGPEELDIDLSIDESARNAGEIELVFAPPRRNRVKLLLLMDVGGSMDPYAELCERLFSAANAANHFKAFKHYFFHNCPYEQLYENIERWKGPTTADVLKQIDNTWTVVIVGDAYMHPYELTHVGGAIHYHHSNSDSGLDWLRRIRRRVPNSVWLNPEPERIWTAPTIRLIRTVYPMFPLTLDGISRAVDVMRGARPNEPNPADPVQPHSVRIW